MTKRKFVIDCDTGTDDAIALCAAFGSPEIDILGITSVNGNVAEPYVAANNLDLCEYLGRKIPVCHGATLPFSAVVRNSQDMTHGRTGLGSVVLPRAAHSTYDPRIASCFIHDTAVACGGELEILATGPLTNIALALIQYPDLPGLIRHIWIMGGAVIGGNVTTTAEFNIWVDPEAAHSVFDAGIPMTMTGLDVTLKTVMEQEDIDQLRARGTRAAIFTADLLDYMKARRDRGGEDLVMHDALALGAALYPECLKFTDYWMDVECRGEYTRGHTFADRRGRLGRKPNVRAATEVDVPMFRHWLVARVNACRDPE